jgi:kynurenine formamidase
VNGADLEAACQAQGVEIGSGDIALLRFGYLDMWWAQNGEPGLDQPGIGIDGAEWLAAKDVVAVGADNAAVEVVPFDDNDFLSVHKVLLVRHGIYMLEFLDLSAPARDECWEGLLSVAPLKVTGATGSPINPIFVG